MSELPCVTGKQAVAVFEKAGFRVARVAGSHHILKREGHPHLLSVPVHGAQLLAKGTLRALIRGSGLSVEEFSNLL
jgi:predicted RNA binding protein YcfA (HicA-like mRNA interferase family)